MEFTWAIDVSLDITASTEDEALSILRSLLDGKVNDWYVDDIHAYGPEVDGLLDPNENGGLT